jgi:hypothetical protein
LILIDSGTRVRVLTYKDSRLTYLTPSALDMVNHLYNIGNRSNSRNRVNVIGWAMHEIKLIARVHQLKVRELLAELEKKL